MTDIEERIHRDLHRRPLPAQQADIGRRSIALGQRIRRRRRGTAAAVVAALALVVGVALGGGNQFGRLGPEPATTLPPGLVQPTLAPAELPQGPAPTVGYVHDGVLITPDGQAVTLADRGSLLTDRANAFVSFENGLFAVRDLDPGPAERVGYSLDGGAPVPVPGVDPRVLGGAQPGPNGSVLIPVVGGYAVAHAGGTWSFAKHFGDPSVPGAPPIAPARTSVFHAVPTGSTTLVRRSELDPKADVANNDQFITTVASDPATDRIVVTDELGCQIIQLQEPWTTLAYTCNWDIKQLSGDGRHVVGLNAEFGWGVINLAYSKPAVVLGKGTEIDSESFRFDALGQLNLVTRSESGDYSVVTCTTAGACWRATAWSPTPYVLVQAGTS